MAAVRFVAATSALFAMMLLPATASEVKSVLRPRGAFGQTRDVVAATHSDHQHDQVKEVHGHVLSSIATQSKTQRLALAVASPAKGEITVPAVVQVPPPGPATPNRLRKRNAAIAVVETAVDATQTGDDSPDAVLLLKQTGDEMKQNIANVDQLRSALSADVALLRESAKLERTARSRASRKAAARQVHESELLVKETGEMLKESRTGAAEAARSALKQAEAASSAAQQLAAEASAELQDMMKQAAATMAPAPMIPTTTGAAVLAAPQAKMTEEVAGDVAEVETSD
eukprot:TRINITY_DN5210_c0_g1_i1.p1 TRINITY_DN5210_c0_g1~~TRINITY_DN5210_c0_g1_i1.p1  ORF type:complete len:286 (+),score=65.61 TRINITY_DN5210_c0_g1_i1:60-917(+)